MFDSSKNELSEHVRTRFDLQSESSRIGSSSNTEQWADVADNVPPIPPIQIASACEGLHF